jgi:hypothetical protein
MILFLNDSCYKKIVQIVYVVLCNGKQAKLMYQWCETNSNIQSQLFRDGSRKLRGFAGFSKYDSLS